MALILSLETSTSVCSASIHECGRLIATSEVHIAQSTASKLALLIKNIEKISGVVLKQLNAVGIASGPGSYTGLRIGTSTAKGICHALNIPLISFNTLDLLAYQINKLNFRAAILCPMIDARRMEVYCKLLDAKLNTVQPIQAKIIDGISFFEFLKKSEIIFFGDGAPKCRDTIIHENAVFIENVYPTSSALGELVFQKYELKQLENLVHFEPFYLKEFVAKKADSSF